MTITRRSFRKVVDRVRTVPALPEVVARVVRLINDPNTQANQVNQLVSKDAALAAQMLHLVNSVYYGLAEPVNGLDQAIRILGLKTVRSIALSLSTINRFQQQSSTFDMKAFWAHSAVCASLCRLIAAKSKVCDPELAFTLGLLKDIGKVILVDNATQETRQIIAIARKRGIDFTSACHEVLDTDDAEIGAWLTGRWQLEAKLVEAIRHQHHLAQTSEPKLVAICQLAEYLCGLKQIRTSGSCDEPHLDPAVWTHLGLDQSALLEFLAVINDEAENARQVLPLAG